MSLEDLSRNSDNNFIKIEPKHWRGFSWSPGVFAEVFRYDLGREEDGSANSCLSSLLSCAAIGAFPSSIHNQVGIRNHSAVEPLFRLPALPRACSAPESRNLITEARLKARDSDLQLGQVPDNPQTFSKVRLWLHSLVPFRRICQQQEALRHSDFGPGTPQTVKIVRCCKMLWPPISVYI